MKGFSLPSVPTRTLQFVDPGADLGGAQNIYHFLKKPDKSISKKISCPPTYPLYDLLPRVKESSKRLRTQTSLLRCVIFKASFINRLYFKYTFAILLIILKM